ncbi:fluoride efflux transporter CrcB [Aureimonas glaciei]|uniref:Fluoride-specific ion channel FluC n=1 Tax=Aureimonas glaciei TaxID=1776957 RepID=A0A917DIK2_9HYPH|nr:fluoride efflux transporter CrcB [Aureimonas glaciei]GGD38994.1 putative fluoride ion transporter CrcB [Aureimonas glaciei]
MLKQILLVAAGGAAGSALRHLVVVGCTRLLGLGFPWGTMAVNIAGSFAMGVLIELLARRFDMSMELRLLLATGFLGGFTTFSSFSLDAVGLFERGSSVLALAYVVGSVLAGIAALVAGLSLVRALA